MALSSPNTAVHVQGSNTTHSVSHTVQAGATVVYVCVYGLAVSDVLDGAPSYGGETMTQVKFIPTRTIHVYRLLDPPTGSQTVEVNYTSSVLSRLGIIDYAGGDETAPEGDTGFGTATGTQTFEPTDRSGYEANSRAFQWGVATNNANKPWDQPTGWAEAEEAATCLLGENAAPGTGAVEWGVPSTAGTGTRDWAGLIIEVKEADTVTIEAPVDDQTFQRNGSDEHVVTISGTYTGNPTTIEYRFDGGTWATLDASPSGRAFSGTATIAAGRGTVEVRFSNATSVTDSVLRVGVGDVFVWLGQSNAVGNFTNSQAYAGAEGASVYSEVDGEWQQLTSGYQQTGKSTYSVLPLLADELETVTGVPVAFIDAADGATHLVASPAEWGDGGTTYDDAVTAINAAAAGGAVCILWTQGEADAVDSVTAANYETGLSDLVDRLQTDCSDLAGVSLFAYLIQREGTADADVHAIREGVLNAAANDADIEVGLSAVDQDFADDIHWSTDAQAIVMADRWARIIDAAFEGGTAPQRGPRIQSASYSGSVVTAVFDVGLTNHTDDTGWLVEDGNGTRTVSSAAQGAAAHEVDVTVDQALVGPVLVSFAYGDQAAGATLGDDETVRFPPEPFYQDGATADGPTYTLSADPASLTLTGTEAALSVGRVLSAEPAILALAGTDASLVASRVLAAEGASLVLTATDATLTVSRVLQTEPASLTVATTDAALVVSRRLNAEAATLTLAGQDAVLSVSRSLAAEGATITLTGTGADLVAGRVLAAEPAILTLASTDASLVYTPDGGPDYTLVAEAETITLAGTDAVLVVHRRLEAEPATLTLAGADAALTVSRVLAADAAVLTLAGAAAGLRLSRVLAADPATLTLAGTAATLTYSGAVIPARLTGSLDPSLTLSATLDPSYSLTAALSST